MSNVSRCFVWAALLWALPAAALAQGKLTDYRNAERFLTGNLQAEMYFAEVHPHWIGASDRFWYLKDRPAGRQFIEVDAEDDKVGPAFDQERLAESLSRAAGKTYDSNMLPFDSFKFVDDGHAILFRVATDRWKCDLRDYACRHDPQELDQRYASVSPDGHWAAYVCDHNLFVRNAVTGVTTQLTHDGKPFDDYATPWPWLGLMVEQGVSKGVNVRPMPAVYWSPDSTRLVTYRMDTRQSGRFHSLQFVPPHRLRPRLFTYVYPLPGEPLPEAMPIVFKVGASAHRIDVKTSPLVVSTWGNPEFGWIDRRHIQYTYKARGEKYFELREVDADTGSQRVLLHEAAAPHPYVDPYTTELRFINGGKQFLWTSERSGWNQLYLYDTASGRLLRRVAHGDWVVRHILHVDEKRREVYFLAGGVQPEVDPYDTRLYRIALDGGDMRLLTPEPADHQVTLSPDGRYFVDNYSTADLPGVSVLRRSSDGAVLRTLERTDEAWLTRQGWIPPISFKGKAADGKTDLYGLIVRPTHFDPARKYPIVESIYTGPHGFFVPKTFRGTMKLQALAELGFVVVMVDGRGTAGRSRAFRDFSYRNLGGVFEDHVAMIRQMAARYPWMDLDRVGIYGYSHGGYGSAHAFLQYPDFYKVCVSTSGDHDPRLDKAGWNELFQGYPLGKDYAEQSNEALVGRLKGHLLLIHGDIDGNVNTVETMRLVDALMTANKPFDMLLVPNMAHGDSGPHANYVKLRRWDYFVRHLLDVQPPDGFDIHEVATDAD